MKLAIITAACWLITLAVLYLNRPAAIDPAPTAIETADPDEINPCDPTLQLGTHPSP